MIDAAKSIDDVTSGIVSIAEKKCKKRVKSQYKSFGLTLTIRRELFSQSFTFFNNILLKGVP